jgi:hypothetical protein
MRWHTGRRSRRLADQGRYRGRLALALLAGLVLLLGWAAVGSPSFVAHADSGLPALSILYPVPANGTSTGPVGANVTISGSGLAQTDKYVLGFATKDTGCAAGFTPIDASGLSPDANGALSDTFAWPQGAGSPGTSYLICLQDATHTDVPGVASAQVYLVASKSAPAIKVQHPPSTTTPTPGQPTPPPLNSSTYYPGSQIRVIGTYFVPGGQQLGVYLNPASGGVPKTRPDLAIGLQQVGGSLTPDNSGSFTADVSLPDPSQAGTVPVPGSYWLCVVSGDGDNNSPPSLEACKKITIQAAPTPTPTPTGTVPPTATPGGSGSGGGGGSNPNLGWAIGLGGLSVVLFFAGVILLASAAAMPRPERFQ